MANEQTAGALMKKVVCVPPETTVSEAARVMKKANIGSVFVGDAEKPDGIFTERDIARRIVAESLDPNTTVLKDVMTRKLVTVGCQEPLDRVFECLAKGQFRHVPITDGDKVVGIVSLTDLAKVLRELAQDEKFLQSFLDSSAR